jgi:DNA modification methylase
MKTTHKIIFQDAAGLKNLPDSCIDLVVTSPPYPMVEMWDAMFAARNKKIALALTEKRGLRAWELMHRELDRVWRELFRVVKEGALVCINVGDAARTIGRRFALYPNHVRIHSALQAQGFSALPMILWRKQTNAPNKFMGSGMLPAGAYVTLEHEYVLIFRKKNKREFKTGEEKMRRHQSAFFWEERNHWFSDVWMDLKGVSQSLFEESTRKRSGAFPFELPYRLITMFSVRGDTVLDPFLGLGTTLHAAMAAGRNGLGYEVDGRLREVLFSRLSDLVNLANVRIADRLNDHLDFIAAFRRKGGRLKHANRHYGFPVMTKQEVELVFDVLASIRLAGENTVEASYKDRHQDGFAGLWRDLAANRTGGENGQDRKIGRFSVGKGSQRRLF